MTGASGAGEQTAPPEIVAAYRAAYAAWEVAKGTDGEFSAWCAVVRASVAYIDAEDAAQRPRKVATDLRRSKLTSGDGRMHVAVKREEHRGCVAYRVIPVYHDDGPEATFARRSEALRVAAAIVTEYERKVGGKHGGE